MRRTIQLMNNYSPPRLPPTDNEAEAIFLESDLDGIITHASERWEMVAGYSRAELAGENMESLIHPCTSSRVIEEMRQTIVGGHPWRGLVYLARKHGGPCEMYLTVSYVLRAGRQVGYQSLWQVPKAGEALSNPPQISFIRLWFRNLRLQAKLQIVIQPVLMVLLGLVTTLVYRDMEAQLMLNVRQSAEASAMQVIDSANTLMVTGRFSNPDFRRLMISKIIDGQHLKSLRLIRTSQVSRQFGPGLPEEQLNDPIVEQVIARSLEAGYPIPYHALEENGGRTYFRMVTPYFTSHEFHGTDCLSCHRVALNSVNGASDLIMDISGDLRRLHRTLAFLVSGQLLLQLFLFVFIGFVNKHFVRRPMEQVNGYLMDIANGKYDRPVDVTRRDEVGELYCAVQTAKVMMGSASSMIHEKLTETVAEKNILERQSQVLEHIILTHERVSYWKDFVREILARFHDIFSFNIFFVAFSDGNGPALSIYYMGHCSDEGKAMTRNGLSFEICERLGLSPQSPMKIEEFQVLESSDCVAIMDMKMIASVIPVDTRTQLSGILGVVYSQSQCLSVQEMRVIRSILAVMVMVVGSSKALGQTLSDLKFHSTHDALTQLPNRNLLQDRIEQALFQAAREGKNGAVLFIDIDRFKNINDSLGHPVGDKVISVVAQRLVSTLRLEDTVARLGGDEFVVVLSGLLRQELVAAVAAKLLACIEEPINLEGHELYLSASVGIALLPGDGDNRDVLMKNADAAMYRAKREGGNLFRFYQHEMNEQLLARISLESRVRRALEKGELRLHYQPQIELASGRIVGVEGLLRWESEGKAIPPLDFIPIIEETGFILPVGEWVLETACKQAAFWCASGAPNLKVAVNLSIRQFRNKSFFETVVHTLERTRCRPECLELEITESILMDNIIDSVNMLQKLAELGVTLTIDDFGTGYSSLAYLKRLPVHALKVDRAFVQNISSDADDAAIVHAVIALAHSLELKVVGEGIEEASQHAFLHNLGCDLGQGFYFSRPLPADAMTALLISDSATANRYDLRLCRVQWLADRIARCRVAPGKCRYARHPGEFCEHPRVEQIEHC